MSRTNGTSRKNVSTLRLRLRLSAFQLRLSGATPVTWERFSRASDEVYHPAEVLRAAERGRQRTDKRHAGRLLKPL